MQDAIPFMTKEPLARFVALVLPSVAQDAQPVVGFGGRACSAAAGVADLAFEVHEELEKRLAVDAVVGIVGKDDVVGELHALGLAFLLVIGAIQVDLLKRAGKRRNGGFGIPAPIGHVAIYLVRELVVGKHPRELAELLVDFVELAVDFVELR